MKTLFNLRNFREIATYNKKTSNYGLETMSYKALFLLAELSSEYKNSTSLSKFKRKTKKWKGDEVCPCWLCKVLTCQIQDMSDMIEA